MNIQTFINEQFGELRTFDIEGTLYFLANDVAAALGYDKVNYARAISKYTSPDDRKALKYADSSKLEESNIRSIWEGNDRKDKTLINESGLYCLIFGSRASYAMEFKFWVTREVLPSIRKNGGYIAGQEDLDPEKLAELTKKISELSDEVSKYKARWHEANARSREMVEKYHGRKKEARAQKECAGIFIDLYEKTLAECLRLKAKLARYERPTDTTKVSNPARHSVTVDKEGMVLSIATE